jgi:hypothetical protein
MPLVIIIMGPSRPWSDRNLFSAFNVSQQLSIRFNTLKRYSTLGGLAVLKRVEPSTVTFRTSLEGRSTRSVGRELLGVKRSVRVQEFIHTHPIGLSVEAQKKVVGMVL